MAGVTANGFEIKTFDEIRSELINEFKTTFGTQFDVTTEGADGQLISIMADALANQWLVAEESYKAFSPSKVFGVSIDNLAELFGISRLTTGGVLETDEDFRYRMLRSTVTRGTSTVDAIYSAFASLGIFNVRVVANASTAALPSGQPIGSVRVVVEGGTDEEVAEVLFSNMTVSVNTWVLSGTDVSITDSGGHPHIVSFERPSYKDVFVNLDISLSDGATPSFESDITSAIMSYVNGRNVGLDVVWSDLFMALVGVGGIAIPSLTVGATGALQASNYVMADNEKAVITADKITINVV